MITVSVGQDEKPLGQVDASWINSELNRRRADGVPICLKVRISEPGLDILLATMGCSRGGGFRPPNSRESAILDLWTKHHLSETNFSVGDVESFLKQLERVLR